MEFDIRRARVDDAMAIAHTHVESWKTTYRGIVPDAYIDSLKVEDRAQRWQENLQEGARRIFVAADESEIFGFICGGTVRTAVAGCDGEGYDGEIDAIYLMQRQQRRGVGRALVRTLADALRAEGLTSMMVWVLEANPAVSFYARLGAIRVTSVNINIGGAELAELALGWTTLDGLS